ncbi:conserved Plasmodium protein, unknown function [Plasmodium ovale wallikeri]|uniref:Uncharacterized protein n=1 Tax=Plasmodium ovale wallikeri TaxID=864142 RepID=A0A1A8YKY3_PLAOA|nr:conserved Plasmodium protein, unknown function [Plasmodium ovale wallikeri]SBT32700.1 conserved Plasmodium protein, unknown function [Plasmodium ovale wallikeri]
MTKVNKPPTTSNPNIKLKKPNSKDEEDFNQPVKKTTIAKNIKVVKKPEENNTPKKSENENVEKDQTKKEVVNTGDNKQKNSIDNKTKSSADNKTKSNADNNTKSNNDANSNVQFGYFSWLWKYFPKKNS